MRDGTIALGLTRFFIRFAGFWMWKDRRGKLIMDLTLGYTILAISGAMYITATDLWYSRNNFYDAAYAAGNALTILVIVMKLFAFTLQRETFLNLIKHCYKHFWERNYDAFGQSVLHECETRCIYFVCTFTFFAQCTVCSYTIHPIIENLGKNDTDRILLLNIWLDLPLTTTPYFEITFFIETMAVVHSGICYFCFDNLFCIMTVHAAGQFRILQRRLELIYDHDGTEDRSVSSKYRYGETSIGAIDRYDRDAEFKKWVRSHRMLIEFVESVGNVYKFVILGQVLLFSLLICLVTYQAVLADGAMSRRMIFIIHSLGSFTQLFMFTLSCDELTRQSVAVGDAAYQARWQCDLSKLANRRLAKNLIFVSMRSRRPCYMTAGGFFPISLETFRTILSTSISYLTLLRQGQEKVTLD